MAMAETIRRKEPGHSPLAAFTVLSENFLHEEWEAIQGLVKQFGTDVRFIRAETSDGFRELFLAPLSHLETPYNTGLFARPMIVEPARAHGCRVILTGFGADELERGSEVGILKDLLRAGRLVRLARELRRMARTLRTSEQALLLEFRDLLSPRVRWVVKMALGRQVPPWIEPRFAKRLGLSHRLPVHPQPRFPTRCQEESFRAVIGSSTVLHLNQMDMLASHMTMEWRHPFLDRRLVEFFLAVPSSVKLHAGYRKSFNRHLLAELVPGLLRDREEEAYFIPPWGDASHRALEATWIQEVLGHSHSPIFRYVRYHGVKRLIRDFIRGKQSNRTPLWKCVHINRWLQQFSAEESQLEKRATQAKPVSVTSVAEASIKGGVA